MPFAPAPTSRLLPLLSANPTLCRLIDRLEALGLPDTWVAGGCLFQTAWNVLSGATPEHAIQDYDVFYFDGRDPSAEAESRANLRATSLLADLGCRVDLRNQARVHLWYEQEFGVGGYAPLTKSTDGIDRFLAVCCMLGARKRGGAIELYAPLGIDDVLSLTMRPNPWFPDAPRAAYDAKARRWTRVWPALKVLKP